MLAIPRLGVVNTHPSRLPRHRGPFPLAWAVREGDDEFGLTVHLMDEPFDTGPDPRAGHATDARGHLARRARAGRRRAGGRAGVPAALRRVLAGDRGEPQSDEGATYAPPFDADYAELDPARRRAELERQVRAWATMFRAPVVGPVATVGGGACRVLAASLDDPADPRCRASTRRTARSGSPGSSGSTADRSASHVRDAAAAAGSRPCDAGTNRNEEAVVASLDRDGSSGVRTGRDARDAQLAGGPGDRGQPRDPREPEGERRAAGRPSQPETRPPIGASPANANM